MDYKISVQIRKHWVPLFEKYGLTAAFENHDHAYKRSFLLKEGKADKTGVLYVGDGSWGASPRKPEIGKKAQWIAKALQARHFILVTVDSQNRKFQTIDHTGSMIDSFDMPVIPKINAFKPTLRVDFLRKFHAFFVNYNKKESLNPTCPLNHACTKPSLSSGRVI